MKNDSFREDEMKALYVSDLDGTLFNTEKKVSSFSAGIINKFIIQGGLFTIATARMAYGCDYKLKNINLNIPGIIMNGACLYSFNDKKYIDVKTIENKKVFEIESILDEFDCNAYMYSLEDNEISIFYKSEKEDQDAQYLSRRALEECRETKRVCRLSDEAHRQVIYFTLTGNERKIQTISDKVKAVKGIESVMYLNIYNGLYCLEIFDDKANKSNALLNLKERVNADEVIVFGDNHNDIGMMQIANSSYAPKNAIDEVKHIATSIIDSCDDNGVAKFIKHKHDLELEG
jgi:Cof subfamily protein (haloacid dehalogenase superfamily)